MKNRKTTKKILTLLLITALCLIALSCDNTLPSEDAPAYVRFERIDRGLEPEYVPSSYSELYWYYTALKADGTGTSGEKTDETLVDENKGFSKSVGPFSQGKWTFTLTAYSEKKAETSTAVYKSGEFTVTLAGGETKSVAVSVKPQGETGYVTFENAYLVTTAESPSLTITAVCTTDSNKTYTFTTAEETSTNVYKIKLGDKTSDNKYLISLDSTNPASLWVDSDGSATYKCTVTGSVTGSFSFAVFSGGATTRISGNIE